jgi:hypothetical protein
MTDWATTLIIDDPELQAEIVRAAHGLLVAGVNRAPDDFIAQLLGDLIAMHPGALVVALGEAHAAIRIALNMGEQVRPSIKDHLLQAIGAALAEGPTT